MASNCLQTPNIILDCLSDEIAGTIKPHVERITLRRRQALTLCDEEVTTIHFPEGGVVSCVVGDDDDNTEAALIGYEGLTGMCALLGDRISLENTFVQVDGTTAIAIPVDVLLDLMEKHAAARSVILLYARYRLLQSNFAILSCSQHVMEARLARWLLMCHDRLDGDTIELTHEFMAMMISAQRSGVTLALHSLEGSGMIRSSRGKVVIADRDKLRELAGSSYGAPERRYSELIAPFGK